MNAPSDLATLLAEHRLIPLTRDCCPPEPWRCVCGAEYVSGWTAEMNHRAHVAEVIEAAGWRQVPEVMQDVRVEVERRLNEPTACKVWRSGALVFDGVDKSAQIPEPAASNPGSKLEQVGAAGGGLSEEEREALAEVLSWASGEMTRYNDAAHPDHNRWSWRGDGHGEAIRAEFLRNADAILASDWLADHDRRVRASALREVEAKIAAQGSCASPPDECYRDHDGCAVADSLRHVRETICAYDDAAGCPYGGARSKDCGCDRIEAKP